MAGYWLVVGYSVKQPNIRPIPNKYMSCEYPSRVNDEWTLPMYTNTCLFCLQTFSTESFANQIKPTRGEEVFNFIFGRNKLWETSKRKLIRPPVENVYTIHSDNMASYIRLIYDENTITFLHNKVFLYGHQSFFWRRKTWTNIFPNKIETICKTYF